MVEKRVGVELVIDSKGNVKIRQAGKELTTLGKKGQKASAALNKGFVAAGNTLSKLGRKAKDLGKNLSLKVTLPITALGGIALKTAIDFENAFTGIRKTVDATEKQFTALKKGFMALAREIPISTEELFGIGEAAGQLGIEQKSILQFTKVMADLGATTNLAANEAATSLARFANITKLSSDDYDKLGSTIVELGNNLATTEAEIVEMGLRLAGAGTIVGLTQPQILALAGALSSVGIYAEAGGTAFSRVMKEIDKNIGKSSQEIQTFAAVSGKSVAKFEKQWKENAAGALIDFVEGLGKVKESGGNIHPILETLGFDNVRISDALLRAAGAGDLFRKALDLGATAWEENIALTKEANLRYGTTASQLTIAKSKASQMAASFGEALVPALIKIIEFLQPVVKWLKELSPTTKTVIVVIAGLAAAIGPLLIALGLMATAIGAISAVSAPVLLTIGGITAAVAVLGVAAYQLIKHWEAVKEFFSNLYTKFKEIGKNLIMGMVEGIRSAAKWLIDAAVGVVNDALAAAKSLLGISSPSKLFAEEVGKPIAEGIAAGIQDNSNLVSDAVTDLADYSLAELQNMLRGEKWMLKDRVQYWYAVQEKIKAGEASMMESAALGAQYGAEQWGNAYEQMFQAAQQIVTAIRDNLADALYEWVIGAKTAEDAFKDMANAIILDIARIITRMMATQIVGMALGMPMYGEGGIMPGSFTPITPMQHGGVYSRPTLGLIAEAGSPEAVVPLKGGKIPVEMKEKAQRERPTYIVNAFSEEFMQQQINKALSQNAEVIVNMVQQDIMAGGNTYQLIRGLR